MQSHAKNILPVAGRDGPSASERVSPAARSGQAIIEMTIALVAILALLTVSVGLFFKIAAVPFHQWAPDAYEGAPTSITAFMSVTVKAAAWAMLLRIFLWGLVPMRALYVPLLIFVALVTLIVGNVAAISQNNVKRLLAYSSISHVGFMLLGLIGSDGITNTTGIQGILVYLLVYTFMNLGAFAVVTSLRRPDIGAEEDPYAGRVFALRPGVQGLTEPQFKNTPTA